MCIFNVCLSQSFCHLKKVLAVKMCLMCCCFFCPGNSGFLSQPLEYLELDAFSSFSKVGLGLCWFLCIISSYESRSKVQPLPRSPSFFYVIYSLHHAYFTYTSALCRQSTANASINRKLNCRISSISSIVNVNSCLSVVCQWCMH